MRILLAPAKKMRVDTDTLAPDGIPVLREKTERLLTWLRSCSHSDLKTLWKCSDKIAEENCQRLSSMDLDRSLTPAILAYDGIAYQYMAPGVFSDDAFRYVPEHLRILSGFYGVLRPMDGVTPYRLEMQAKVTADGCRDLYDFWGDALYRQARDESGIFLDLASKEYSKAVRPYLTLDDTWITCLFGEEENGKVIQKGVYAKMARGEMVRFLAEGQVKDPEAMRRFDRLGFRYDPQRSTPTEYVFLRENQNTKRR